jgi:hypothetical protein
MKLWRMSAWTILCLLLVLLAWLTSQTAEAFENMKPKDEEAELKSELTILTTKVSEVLCPAIKEVLRQMTEDNLSDEQKGTPEQERDQDQVKAAKEKAIRELKLKSLGQGNNPFAAGLPNPPSLLFPCPAPTDPLVIPQNIDQMILATCKACSQKISEIKSKIEEARSCPQTKEKFTVLLQNSHYNQEAFDDIKASEDPAVKQARIASLTAKRDAFQRAMLTPEYTQLSVDYQTLMDLKAKTQGVGGDSPDYNALKPNCPSK